MQPQIDKIGPFTLRAAAVLTTSYVGALLGSVLGVQQRIQDYNQLVVYVDFTLGSLTSSEIKIEFTSILAGTDLYQETDETSALAANVDTKAVNLVIHQMSATGKYRFSVPVYEGDVKISIKGTGTVTGSSAKVTFNLFKNYS